MYKNKKIKKWIFELSASIKIYKVDFCWLTLQVISTSIHRMLKFKN